MAPPSRHPRRHRQHSPSPSPPPPPAPPPSQTTAQTTPNPSNNPALNDYLSALTLLSIPSRRQTLQSIRNRLDEDILILGARQMTARHLLANLLCIPGDVPENIETTRRDERMRTGVIAALTRDARGVDIGTAAQTDEGFRDGSERFHDLNRRVRGIWEWMEETVERLGEVTMPDLVEEWMKMPRVQDGG